jgi:hypothetical protein
MLSTYLLNCYLDLDTVMKLFNLQPSLFTTDVIPLDVV